MKHFSSIFLFVFSYLLANTIPADVKHIVIDHDGNTTECFVDSIGYQYVYFIPKDSVDTDSMKLKNAYYIYSDYDRIFHHSWSFEENIKRMEHRTGKAYTIDGDTLDFIDLKFDKDMITPEVLFTTGPGKSKYISMFDLEKIETDYVLSFFGLDPIPFLADENLATYGIIIASFFPGIAYTMILYITGLTGVSREMIEAGRIDGASGFTMLWHVVLPQLRAATLIAIVVTLVGALRAFDLIAVMTAGGPWGSSEVLAYKMYQEALFNYRMGYGAAIATILFLIMDIYIAWFLYRLFKNERSEK